MILYKNHIINPGKFRSPIYNISPFTTESIRNNYKIIQSSNHINEQLLKSYFGEHIFFESGKKALFEALRHYSLKEDDEVFISTTTGNSYISSCVTHEISKFCKWNMQITSRTKLVYVNHEFGVVHKNMKQILELGLPIIEDVAMSMFSTDSQGHTGSYGDFTIFSLPKFFPLQFGGVLKINNLEAVTRAMEDNGVLREMLGKLSSHYLENAEQICRARIINHECFSQKMSLYGFSDRFNFQPGETPSVYMFSADFSIDLNGLKTFLQANGVESSVFYGEPAFFVPVHQDLTEVDIDFIVLLVEYYCSEIDELHKLSIVEKSTCLPLAHD